jgi:hypothetical protein
LLGAKKNYKRQKLWAEIGNRSGGSALAARQYIHAKILAMNLAAMVRNVAQLIATRRFAHRKFAHLLRGCGALLAMNNNLVRLLNAGPIDLESLLEALIPQLSSAADAVRPKRSFPPQQAWQTQARIPSGLQAGSLQLTALGVEVGLLVLAVSARAPLLLRKLMHLGQGDFLFSLVATSTLLAIFVVPAWLAVLGFEFGNPIQLEPGLIALVFAKSFFAPLALGMAVRWLFPAFAERIFDGLIEKAGIVLTGNRLARRAKTPSSLHFVNAMREP